MPISPLVETVSRRYQRAYSESDRHFHIHLSFVATAFRNTFQMRPYCHPSNIEFSNCVHSESCVIKMPSSITKLDTLNTFARNSTDLSESEPVSSILACLSRELTTPDAGSSSGHLSQRPFVLVESRPLDESVWPRGVKPCPDLSIIPFWRATA